jgi:hypothetical protein
MADLKTICPYNENDIVIPEDDIRKAVMFKNKSKGKALVTCPDCCNVVELKGTGVPDTVEEWHPDVSKMVCVPFLDDTLIRIPAGIITEANVKKYRPGSGEDMLPKREYMSTYGIDPECYYVKKNKK